MNPHSVNICGRRTTHVHPSENKLRCIFRPNKENKAGKFRRRKSSLLSHTNWGKISFTESDTGGLAFFENEESSKGHGTQTPGFGTRISTCSCSRMINKQRRQKCPNPCRDRRDEAVKAEGENHESQDAFQHVPRNLPLLDAFSIFIP